MGVNKKTPQKAQQEPKKTRALNPAAQELGRLHRRTANEIKNQNLESGAAAKTEDRPL
jgi:hypothetical protein